MSMESKAPHPWESETEVGNLLAAIIKLAGFKSVLDLGTLEGKTTDLMLQALPADGTLTTVDIQDHRSDTFKEICDIDSRVKYIIGDSIKTCTKLKGQKFDLVYIDTVHEYSYALPEFKAIEQLINAGSVLAYHDTIKFPGVAKLIKYAQLHNYNAVTLNTPNANGLTLLQK